MPCGSMGGKLRQRCIVMPGWHRLRCLWIWWVFQRQRCFEIPGSSHRQRCIVIPDYFNVDGAFVMGVHCELILFVFFLSDYSNTQITQNFHVFSPTTKTWNYLPTKLFRIQNNNSKPVITSKKSLFANKFHNQNITNCKYFVTLNRIFL